jgi:hypothetical protein
MRKYGVAVSLALAAATLVPNAFAQRSEINNPLPRHFPTQQRFVHEFVGPGGGAGGNLAYHGGPVIPVAHVIPIYWGSNWSAGTDASIASSLTSYIGTSTGGFGQTGEYNVITQYYEVVNNAQTFISKPNLGSAGSAIYDNSTPPTNVTDAALQAEVISVTGGAPRSDTIYEVFLPSTSYSSSGSYTSCGGPNLYYCAYHGNFTYLTTDVKYASMPYPSCGGCQNSGFTTTQNFEHFISHETREAVTDEDGNAWFDRRGYEADDKCAWSPTPFTDSLTGKNADGTAFAYQYEWSNANSACVKTR